jgi:hypothetical protein
VRLAVSAPFFKGTHGAVPIPPETRDGLNTTFADPNQYGIDGRAVMYHLAPRPNLGLLPQKVLTVSCRPDTVKKWLVAMICGEPFFVCSNGLRLSCCY